MATERKYLLLIFFGTPPVDYSYSIGLQRSEVIFIIQHTGMSLKRKIKLTDKHRQILQ